MDKNLIKKYAVWAREELIKRVSTKAQEYGITEENIVDANAESINERILSKDEISERRALIHSIKENGYEQTIDEVAYTWFNRFCALRFMEVNKYLPSRVRVFTDESGAFDPQILKDAIHLEMPGLNRNKVIELKQANEKEALYKYLIITQCNALNAVLPRMFQRISDYTELLFPDNILREGSVVEQLVTAIPEDNWKDAIQIIGWLYQYYNSVPKDKVFANLKKNIKIKKEDIPAATQLFTPDWIVRYMVENSLGRIFVDHRKNEGIYGDGRGEDEMSHSESEAERIAKENEIASEMGWNYFLPEAEQDEEVRKQLDAHLADAQENFNVKDIKVIDPCMGSGHILVYTFDVLMQIYMERGYAKRDAVKSIIENNLYGLDIDERASQLAYFAVMMVALKYDNRFLTRTTDPIPQPNVFAIVESNHIDKFALEYFINGDENLKSAMNSIMLDMLDAKEYGSIIDVKPVDFSALFARFDEVKNEINMYTMPIADTLLPMVKVAFALAQKYDVVVTNPPYMNSSGMSDTLSSYVKKNYSDSKSDMSTVFMEKTLLMSKTNGYMSMINIPVWMMLTSFENLRIKMLLSYHIVNMLHNGRGVFGSDFGTTAFVFQNAVMRNYKGKFYRLFDKVGDVETNEAKEIRFFSGNGKYVSTISNFSKIPGTPIAYSASPPILSAFEGISIGKIANPIEGIKSGDNEQFLRFWFEVSDKKIAKLNSFDASISKWCFTTKGGAFRKWYGNIEYVIDWTGNGEKLGAFKGSTIYKNEYWMMPAITWTYLTAGGISFRLLGKGMLYNNKGPAVFCNDMGTLTYISGLLNSVVGSYILSFICSTLTFLPGDIRKVPVIEKDKSTIINSVNREVMISKTDWDSFETSWDFKTHPLIAFKGNYEEAVPMLYEDDLHNGVNPVEYEKGLAPITQAYEAWERFADNQFQKLKANEEELNRIFIDIYGLQDELTPEVEDKDVTVRHAELGRDVRSFISYAVGCMFGRYSLDVDGLVYAGGNFDEKYCRWMEYFGNKANEEIDENGSLIHGAWAGSSMWKYDGVRRNGEWIKAAYAPDTDNIIPICDDEYFDDDIVGRFVKFVATVYGADTLDANLRFIADALGGKGSPKEVIRGYFLNDFYADHLKIYQKRPIYWLFDSGKKGGFKALIYMHRYQPDTIARMRTDYVHEQQARYRTAITDLEHRINDAGTSERVKLQKELTKLQDQDNEIRTYEEKIHHLADQMIRIDLDDGVKHNYEIFKDVLAPIK